jgi:hypothetical protein
MLNQLNKLEEYILSREADNIKQVLFFGAPKSCSSYVEQRFRENKPNRFFYPGHGVFDKEFFKISDSYFSVSKIGPATFTSLKEFVSVNRKKYTLSFSVIRNPYDYFVSLYTHGDFGAYNCAHRLRRPLHACPAKKHKVLFKRFILENLLKVKEFPFLQLQAHPWFYLFYNGVCQPELIFKKEMLVAQCDILQKRFNLTGDDPGLINMAATRPLRNSGDDWREWWDEDMIEAFYSFFKSVFVNLGYKKDGTTEKDKSYLLGKDLTLNVEKL